jgi:phosphoinositide-3-kinase, regulatory subunit 4
MGNAINVRLHEDSVAILNEAIATHPILRQYKVEATLVPGSGRMTRTYRLRHGSRVEASAVLKASAFVEGDDSAATAQMLAEQQRELERIKGALLLLSSSSSSTSSSLPHVAPFMTWFVEPPRMVRGAKIRTVFMLRPHLYTTLSDRLASRPWLTAVEKTWIAHQLLQALSGLHGAGVCHGFLTTENVGLTSLSYVTLVDLSSYKAVQLRDDDPSQYLQYFQLQHDPSHLHVKRSEKRCYIAPERFSGGSDGSSDCSNATLTPAMDVFSAGCVIAEVFLNGERLMDLGDLIEYRKLGELPAPIQQKLAKIESSHLRAACRHMLQLQPSERMSANEYWQRLEVGGQFPPSFPVLTEVLERMNAEASPDARAALAISRYETVLWETMGERDLDGTAHFAKALGSAAVSFLSVAANDNAAESTSAIQPVAASANPETHRDSPRDLLAETEELLRQLNDLEACLSANSTVKPEKPGVATAAVQGTEPGRPETKVQRSEACRNSLLIYLHLVLATVQKVQRPATKIITLRLIERLAKYAGDEARLQRIVPVAISLLHDQDPIVRAAVLKTLTTTLSIIQSFSPSDSKVFPQYILKSVTPLVTDPSLVVRVVLARCVATLAETALRFLDISHAVRLYEAVGGGTGAVTPEDRTRKVDVAENVFTDDLTRLLDAKSADDSTRMAQAKGANDASRSESRRTDAGRTLIGSTYVAEFSGLVDTISRWVVSIATDQSEHSALPKRALLHDLNRLCSFFGLEGVMSFILPQTLAFLNERKNWELRAALFDAMPSVCHIVGRSATEEFVLPCVEIGLVDVDEAVICRALSCLLSLIRMNLISVHQLVGAKDTGNQGLLVKYSALLVHPSSEIRHEAICVYSAAFAIIGSPSTEVLVFPWLLSFLRYQASVSVVVTSAGLESCLRPPLKRAHFQAELRKASGSSNPADSIDGPWTSVEFRFGEEIDQRVDKEPPLSAAVADSSENNENYLRDANRCYVRAYLRMLARHSPQPSNQAFGTTKVEDLAGAIEGSVKLSQNIMIPRQDTRNVESIPIGYATLRGERGSLTSHLSERTPIRSLAVLGRVYGLSIMNSLERQAENVVGERESEAGESDCVDRNPLGDAVVEAACRGHWGSETLVDPDAVDTTLLMAKLRGLNVPPLPPALGQTRQQGKLATSRDSAPLDWRPKTNSLLARSAVAGGHTAPVVRLAVSTDSSFIVSGSYDGTCRVWDLSSVEESTGLFESSLVYAGHSEGIATCRVNDVAVVEGGHSVVSGSSKGSVHVWRVETMSPTLRTAAIESSRPLDRSKVVGSTCVRIVDTSEGEVSTVNHFNSLSSSVLTYGTQKGIVHAWDLRCGEEPFRLAHGPELGHLTSTALGGDRHWVVSGTSRGYVTLWDVRFQQPVKVWQHPSGNSIARLATSVVAPPQKWGAKMNESRSRPFVFVAAGRNECSMFDAMTGKCFECFRTVPILNGELNGSIEAIADLVDVPLSAKGGRNLCAIETNHVSSLSHAMPIASRVNCLVGSIGQNQSFLITGDSDANIRFWDFASTSKCFTVCGPSLLQRPSFERIDFEDFRRLMLCRVPNFAGNRQAASVAKAGHCHSDAVTDLKIIENRWLITCSRDCTIRIWR